MRPRRRFRALFRASHRVNHSGWAPPVTAKPSTPEEGGRGASDGTGYRLACIGT